MIQDDCLASVIEAKKHVNESLLHLTKIMIARVAGYEKMKQFEHSEMTEVLCTLLTVEHKLEGLASRSGNDS